MTPSNFSLLHGLNSWDHYNQRFWQRGKERGAKLGNPEIAKARELAHKVHLASGANAQTVTLIHELRQQGLSLRGIANTLYKRGINPPRSGRWSASSINSILKRPH